MKDFYQKNSYYEGLIQNLFAGNGGCFCAFMQFFYQYNQSEEFAKKEADCLKTLYQTELENCEILSQILLKMGGDNKFYSSSKKFLSGANVDYIKNFNNAFLADVEFLEINNIEIKNIINKIENIEIKNKLKKVLENKQKELKILKENFFLNNMLK